MSGLEPVPPRCGEKAVEQREEAVGQGGTDSEEHDVRVVAADSSACREAAPAEPERLLGGTCQRHGMKCCRAHGDWGGKGRRTKESSFKPSTSTTGSSWADEESLPESASPPSSKQSRSSEPGSALPAAICRALKLRGLTGRKEKEALAHSIVGLRKKMPRGDILLRPRHEFQASNVRVSPHCRYPAPSPATCRCDSP